jgi:hypothetical protein
MVTKSPTVAAGEHLAHQMLTRALDNSVRPDVALIAEMTGLRTVHVTGMLERLIATRRPVVSPGTRQAVLLRLADQLTAQADVLRRMARDLTTEMDPTLGRVCTACGREFPSRQALANHTTRTHQPKDRP